MYVLNVQILCVCSQQCQSVAVFDTVMPCQIIKSVSITALMCVLNVQLLYVLTAMSTFYTRTNAWCCSLKTLMSHP